MDPVEIEQDPRLHQVMEGSPGARAEGSRQEEELAVNARRTRRQPAEHPSHRQGEHILEGEPHHDTEEKQACISFSR